MADRIVTTGNTVLDLRETYNLTAQDVGDIANLNSTTFTGTPTNVVDAVVLQLRVDLVQLWQQHQDNKVKYNGK